MELSKVNNPYRVLCGKYRDPGLVYEVVEESVDEVLLGEVRAMPPERRDN